MHVSAPGSGRNRKRASGPMGSAPRPKTQPGARRGVAKTNMLLGLLSMSLGIGHAPVGLAVGEGRHLWVFFFNTRHCSSIGSRQ